MAIDIKNINEITFTQSFRGYNTEEVDDFLDDLYEEASQNNREIEELKKKLKALESGESPGGGISQEEAYAVISNAQEEADKIIEAARRKAHALIESAEKHINEKQSMPAASAGMNGLNTESLDKLKNVLRDTYEKQMTAINAIAGAKPEIKQPEEKKSDIPSVSFSGITKEFPSKIPAERDILGEISSIGIEGFNSSDKNRNMNLGSDKEIKLDDSAEETRQGAEPEPEGFAFSFAESDEHEEEKHEAETQYQENEPEDPDDIIAQILRDNNRN